MKKWAISAVFLLLCSCEPTSLADLRCEGESEIRKLAAVLGEIETKEELEKSSSVLKKRFNRIADLMIKVRQFPLEESADSPAGEELFAEMARLYEIPGCREIIEQSQSDAVRQLRLR